MTEYLLITMDNCPHCDRAEAMLAERGIDYREVNIMDAPELGILPSVVGHRTMPLIFKVIGGADDLEEVL